MNHFSRFLTLFVSVFLLLFAVSCSESDSGNNSEGDDAEAWVGTWLSAGTDVAPLLVSLFQYDSVRVTINEDLTITTESHVTGGAWGTVEGTYVVTENDGSDILTVQFVYAAFEQEGIMEITAGTPDLMKLEVVQSLPNIGAVPRTAATGFGSDAALGTINIQNYKRIE